MDLSLTKQLWLIIGIITIVNTWFMNLCIQFLSVMWEFEEIILNSSLHYIRASATTS